MPANVLLEFSDNTNFNYTNTLEWQFLIFCGLHPSTYFTEDVSIQTYFNNLDFHNHSSKVKEAKVDFANRNANKSTTGD